MFLHQKCITKIEQPYVATDMKVLITLMNCLCDGNDEMSMAEIMHMTYDKLMYVRPLKRLAGIFPVVTILLQYILQKK